MASPSEQSWFSDEQTLLLADRAGGFVRGDAVRAACGVLPWNALDATWSPSALAQGFNTLRLPPDAALLVRSGWIDPDGENPLPLWRNDFREKFSAFARELTLAHAATQRTGPLVLWPRASDVISDAPSLLTFLRADTRSTWRFVLDPQRLLTSSMEPRTQEHVARWVESLAAHERCWGILAPRESSEGSAPVRTAILDALERGGLPVRRVRV